MTVPALSLPSRASRDTVTLGERLVACLRSQPWTETEAWIQANCDWHGLHERLRRLRNVDVDYRLDRMHLAVPGGLLGHLGDRLNARSVFRGLPAAHQIRPGDWVALDHDYAVAHQRDGGRVASLDMVDPGDIYWAGTDTSEFFYLPRAWRRPQSANTHEHLEALSDEQLRMLCDGETARSVEHESAVDRIAGAVIENFAHESCGIIHGPEHWARVGLHARALARAEGIDPLIPSLFAMVHDSQRRDDGFDPEHGRRAADFISASRSTLFGFLRDDEVSDLVLACRLHSDGHVDGNAVVRACWDADRLDLGRQGVEIEPDSRWLCTDRAKRSSVIMNACLLNGYLTERTEDDGDDGNDDAGDRAMRLNPSTTRSACRD